MKARARRESGMAAGLPGGIPRGTRFVGRRTPMGGLPLPPSLAPQLGVGLLVGAAVALVRRADGRHALAVARRGRRRGEALVRRVVAVGRQRPVAPAAPAELVGDRAVDL